MVSPSQRRHAVRSVVAAGVCSLRQACRYLDLARSSLGYRRRPPDERRMQVEAAIVEESRRHPRHGYRRVHALIERRGFGCARLMRQECLWARQRSKFRAATTDSSHPGPIAPNRILELKRVRPDHPEESLLRMVRRTPPAASR